MRFKFFTTNKYFIKAIYRITDLNESFNSRFAFKKLSDDKICQAVCFIDLDGNLI